MYRGIVMMAMAGLTLLGLGCQSTPKRTVLPAPAGANIAAVQHNDEGTRAYQQGQWDHAKHHFEAAIAASPDLAEAHYNLGMTFYRLKAVQEGDVHFIKAANLAPGNKVIWDAPPLKGVTVPDKEVPGMSDDGHIHSH